MTLAVAAGRSAADVDLEWRPETQTVSLGDPIEISLYAVSDDAQQDQALAGMDVVIAWDVDALHLLGADQADAVDLLFSGFPDEPFNLNETVPPQDGDGFYQALAPLGEPVLATPDGVLITTLQFQAVAMSPDALLEILTEGGSPPTQSVVWDGNVPNLPVTGMLGSAAVLITGPGDLDIDGDLDLFDVDLFVQCASGPELPAEPQCTPADLDDDGDVDFHDYGSLQVVLSAL